MIVNLHYLGVVHILFHGEWAVYTNFSDTIWSKLHASMFINDLFIFRISDLSRLEQSMWCLYIQCYLNFDVRHYIAN